MRRAPDARRREDAGHAGRGRDDGRDPVVPRARLEHRHAAVDGRLEPAREEVRDARELEHAGDRGQHGQDVDRDQHRPRALAVLGVVRRVLRGVLGRLAAEHDEHQPRRVQAGEERAERRRRRTRGTPRSRPAARPQARMVSFEMPPDSGNTPASASVPIHMQMRGARQPLLHAAHLADVLLVGERVDDDAGAHEQQRLEERVRGEVEDAGPVRAEADADEHVGDLAHRRVRDDALDVGLRERDQAGHQQAGDADRDDQRAGRRARSE